MIANFAFLQHTLCAVYTKAVIAFLESSFSFSFNLFGFGAVEKLNIDMGWGGGLSTVWWNSSWTRAAAWSITISSTTICQNVIKL